MWSTGSGIGEFEFIGMHLARKAFYRLNRLIADSDIVLDMAEFFLISAPSVMRSSRTTRRNRFYAARWPTLDINAKVSRMRGQTRIAGRTHYSLLRASRFRNWRILSSSTFPLRLSAYAFPFLVLGTSLCFCLIGSMVSHTRPLVSVLLCRDARIYLARTYKMWCSDRRPCGLAQSTLPKPD